jgi:hypothetical protein
VKAALATEATQEHDRTERAPAALAWYFQEIAMKTMIAGALALVTLAGAGQALGALPTTGESQPRLARNEVLLPSQRPVYLAGNSVVLPSQRPAYLS